MHTLYSLKDVLHDEAVAKAILLEHGFYKVTMLCPKCEAQMYRDLKRWKFRCGKRSCDVERSMNTQTFLAKSRLKAHQMLMLGRLWVSKVSVSSAIDLTGHSSKTIVDFWVFFRQLVVSTLNTEDNLIGGDGIIVEVDETKLGNILIQESASIIADTTLKAYGSS